MKLGIIHGIELTTTDSEAKQYSQLPSQLMLIVRIWVWRMDGCWSVFRGLESRSNKQKWRDFICDWAVGSLNVSVVKGKSFLNLRAGDAGWSQNMNSIL